MPRIDLDILNQKQTPAFYASSLATRPAASFVGRIFIDSDNPSTGLYRDTGTAWVQIADPGAGTTGTLQQVTTNGSSTTVGISTSGNGIGIGTTIPASNRLDIHSASGINATFNGTGVTNAALQFQLAGVGKWNVGNLYNSASNDFIIFDVVNTINRVTVKNTGQTFIGADTTSSGALVVNNATSDNHIVCIGANSPSIRLRNAGSGGTINIGIGVATGINAYIQGSVSGDYCIFNASSTASPILFGIYDAGTGNTQEAVRISAARNLLVGTATDGGYKLSVLGSANFSSSVTASSGSTGNSLKLINTSNLNEIQFGYTSSGLYNYIQVYDGTNFQKLVINNTLTLNASAASTFSASVGIGGVVATDYGIYRQLAVYGGSTGGGITIASTGSATGALAWANGTTGTSQYKGYIEYQHANDKMAFATLAIERMSIKNTGVVNIISTSIYATNALALAGGLVAGDIYKSATGVLSIVY